MTPRQAAKNASFGMLYGSSYDSSRPLVAPWEPSAVERLAALADPVMARKVAEFDNPWLRSERLAEQWKKMWSGTMWDGIADLRGEVDDGAS